MARVVRIWEKTAGQDLISEEDIKFMGNDLDEDRLIIVRESAVVRGGNNESGELVYGWSERAGECGAGIWLV